MTLEEFETLGFDGKRTQLIRGRVVVAERLPSVNEGTLAATLVELIGVGLRRYPEAGCRPGIGMGLRAKGDEVGLAQDSYLRPVIQVQCRSGDGRRSAKLVVEILSPDNPLDNVLDKIEVYKALPTISEILVFSATEMRVRIVSRGEGNSWWTRHLNRSNDDFILQQWSIRLVLEQIYGDQEGLEGC